MTGAGALGIAMAGVIVKKEVKNMSYDIELIDPNTNKTIEFPYAQEVRGGTYQLGGTNQAWVNITYNYGQIFRDIFGEKGIRTIYGLTGRESIPLLEQAIDRLNDDISNDYWEATEGNAKQSLKYLLIFAQLRPDGVWNGD